MGLNRWRYDRMWRQLGSTFEHTLETSANLQHDVTSLLAQALVAKLPARDDSRWVKRLRAWDTRLTRDSAEAALYAVWLYRHLRPALAREILPSHPELIEGARSARGFLRKLDEKDYGDLLVQTLDGAAAETATLLGDDPAKWRWGDLHQARFRHPLYERAAGTLRQDMHLPAFGRGGDGSTTNVNNFRVEDFSIVHGASFSMILDVGNWDASRMTNTPGQSGDPRSPFYDNLLEGWANDGTFPLLFTRERILEHEALRIHLSPHTTN